MVIIVIMKIPVARLSVKHRLFGKMNRAGQEKTKRTVTYVALHICFGRRKEHVGHVIKDCIVDKPCIIFTGRHRHHLYFQRVGPGFHDGNRFAFNVFAVVYLIDLPPGARECIAYQSV